MLIFVALFFKEYFGKINFKMQFFQSTNRQKKAILFNLGEPLFNK